MSVRKLPRGNHTLVARVFIPLVQRSGRSFRQAGAKRNEDSRYENGGNQSKNKR